MSRRFANVRGMRKHLRALVAIGVVAILGLTGCAGTSESAAPQETQTQASAVVEEAPTVEDVPTPAPTQPRERDATLCEAADFVIGAIQSVEGADDATRVATIEEAAKTFDLLSQRAVGEMADALTEASEGAAEWAFQGAPAEGRHATNFYLSLSDMLDLCIDD